MGCLQTQHVSAILPLEPDWCDLELPVAFILELTHHFTSVRFYSLARLKFAFLQIETLYAEISGQKAAQTMFELYIQLNCPLDILSFESRLWKFECEFAAEHSITREHLQMLLAAWLRQPLLQDILCCVLGRVRSYAPTDILTYAMVIGTIFCRITRELLLTKLEEILFLWFGLIAEVRSIAKFCRLFRRCYLANEAEVRVRAIDVQFTSNASTASFLELEDKLLLVDMIRSLGFTPSVRPVLQIVLTTRAMQHAASATGRSSEIIVELAKPWF